MSDSPDRCGATEGDDPSGAGIDKGKNMNAEPSTNVIVKKIWRHG